MKRVDIPENSILKKDDSFEFIDAYQKTFYDSNDEVDIQKICKLFFTSDPKWIDKLFSFRNKIVKLFGLKVTGNITDKKQLIANLKCKSGEQIGLFKIFSVNQEEIILGEDDKHLDFRLSLFLENINPESNEKLLTISTSVRFNNNFGKLYFIPVKPFHKLIVPTMLNGIIKEMS